MLFDDYFLWICKKYDTLNCQLMLTFILVFAILRVFCFYHKFRLNVDPNARDLGYCFVNIFSAGPSNFANNVFYSTFLSLAF